jgi:cytochrome P450
MLRNGSDKTVAQRVYCDDARVWHVTRYTDLRDALKSPDLGANLRLMLARHSAVSHVTTNLLRGSPIFVDGPARTHVRHLVVTFLRQGFTDALRRSVENIASDLVEQIDPGIETDAVRNLADRLPSQVISHLIGVPADLGQIFCQHAAMLGEGTMEPFPSTTRMLELEASALELTHHLGPLLTLRSRQPGDDLLSYLVSRRDPEALDDEGLLALTVFLLIAAMVTTASFLSATVHTLAETPEPLHGISADPQLMRDLLNEVLRHRTPLQVILRRCLRDTRIGGVNVPAGAGVMLHLGTGNRDPAEFETPDLFLAGRSNILNHLAFGGGSHACPGARLALLEGEAMIGALGRRFHRVSADRSCQWKKIPALMSIAELPVVFHE